MRKELRRLAIALALGWIVVGFISYGPAIFLAGVGSSPQTMKMPPVLWTLLSWVTRAAFIPVFILLMRRYPLSRRNFVRRLLLHAFFCLGLASIHALVNLAVRSSFTEIDPARLVRILAGYARYATLNYALVAAAVFLVYQQRLARHSELTRIRLERKLARARLERTLVTVDAAGIVQSMDEIDRVMKVDAAGAEQMIFALSNTLREKVRRITDRANGSFRVGAPEQTNVRWMHRHLKTIAFAVYPVYSLSWFATAAIEDWITGIVVHWRDLGNIFYEIIPPYAVAAAVSPIILAMCRTLAPAGAHWRRSITVVVLGAIVSGVVAELAMAGLRQLFGVGPAAGRSFDPAFYVSFIAASVLQAGRHSEWRAAQALRTQAVLRDVIDAQLITLRRQLTPHFLFNALNSVLSLLEADREAAHVMLAKLKRVLQLTFRHDSVEEVTVRMDLELTRNYLEIERVRFRDALDVDVDVDPSLLDAAVPSFLLQPLVENAVRHGALASRGRGHIVLRIRRVWDSMEIRVDNECDLLQSDDYHEGVGLSNIRQRLQHLYGRQHRLMITALEDHGFSVRIELPIKHCRNAA